MLQKEDEKEWTGLICRAMTASCDHSNEFPSAQKSAGQFFFFNW